MVSVPFGRAAPFRLSRMSAPPPGASSAVTRAAVRLGDLAHDREPEPRAGHRAGRGRAVEAVEDERPVLRRDARAVVADAQLAAARGRPRRPCPRRSTCPRSRAGSRPPARAAPGSRRRPSARAARCQTMPGKRLRARSTASSTSSSNWKRACSRWRRRRARARAGRRSASASPATRGAGRRAGAAAPPARAAPRRAARRCSSAGSSAACAARATRRRRSGAASRATSSSAPSIVLKEAPSRASSPRPPSGTRSLGSPVLGDPLGRRGQPAHRREGRARDERAGERGRADAAERDEDQDQAQAREVRGRRRRAACRRRSRRADGHDDLAHEHLVAGAGRECDVAVEGARAAGAARSCSRSAASTGSAPGPLPPESIDRRRGRRRSPPGREGVAPGCCCRWARWAAICCRPARRARAAS